MDEIQQLRSQILELSERLDSLQRNRDTEIEVVPTLEDDPSVPRVTNLQLVGFSGTTQLDEISVSFEVPSGAPNFRDIEGYEIYTRGTTNIQSEYSLLTTVTRSPIVIPIASNVTGVMTIAIRTQMKNGLGSPVEASPTLTVDISALNATIAAGSIGTTELADDAVTQAKIADLAVGTAQIQDLAVTNAKINSLVANKITAGTLQAGVIYAGAIAATQITAGTINSVNINAGTYSLTSGTNQMLINGVDGFTQLNTTTGARVRMLGGGLAVFSSALLAVPSSISMSSSTSAPSISIGNSLGVMGIGVSALGVPTITMNSLTVLTTRKTGPAAVVGTAGVTYTATEQGIINALVTAVNTLRTALNAATGHGLVTTV